MKGNRFVMRAAIALCALVIGAAALAGCGSKNNPNSSSPQNALQGTGNLTTGSTGSTNGSGKNDPNKIVPQDPGDSNKDTNEISKEPPPVQILTGDMTGVRVSRPTVIIAQTSAQRKAVLKRHFSGKGVPNDPVSGTNFGDRQLVGLFMPPQNKGTLIVITDVHQEGKHVVVQSVRLTLGKNCKASGPRPRPYHFVETRKMDVSEKPVVKVQTQRASPC